MLVFATEERQHAILEQCRSSGISWKKEEISDHTGEVALVYVLDAFGLPVQIFPCNDFHRDGDFELGFAAESESKWAAFLSHMQTHNIAFETGSFSDGGFYAIPTKPHGPAFFLYPAPKADITKLCAIQAELPAGDFRFFKDYVQPWLDDTIARKCIFHEGTRFFLTAISFNAVGSII